MCKQTSLPALNVWLHNHAERTLVLTHVWHSHAHGQMKRTILQLNDCVFNLEHDRTEQQLHTYNFPFQTSDWQYLSLAIRCTTVSYLLGDWMFSACTAFANSHFGSCMLQSANPGIAKSSYPATGLQPVIFYYSSYGTTSNNSPSSYRNVKGRDHDLGTGSRYTWCTGKTS